MSVEATASALDTPALIPNVAPRLNVFLTRK